jgi:hypothetical protein
MKRFWLSIAALGVLAITAGGASAQFPPPNGSGPGLLQAGGYGPVAAPYAIPVYGTHQPTPEEAAAGNRYGLHPVLKRLFHIKSESCSGGCGADDCGGGKTKLGHGGHGGGYGHPGHVGPNNPAQGGTLVFPQQPFIRSPRDFFYTPQR